MTWGILVVAFTIFFGAAAPVMSQEVWSVGRGELSLNVTEAKFIKLEKTATAVFISNPNVADIDLQSSRYLYIVGKNVGTSTLYVLGENDEEILSTTISVGIDAERLEAAANHAILGGHVDISTRDGAVFLTGRVQTEDDAATAGDVVAALLGENAIIVNRLELAVAAQVNLQVRIAEVSRSISEDLGISLTTSSSTGRSGFNSPALSGGGYEITLGSGSRNINLVLDALARNGLVTILSEPNLTARSGETASFLAGGRFPYPVDSGEDKVSYELEPIGVELEFTPTVFGQDQIQLKINTRVRDVDPANSVDAKVPALTERSATTTVELGSGQSFAIAGMFQADTVQSLSGLPGLINLPIIGALFRSSRFSRGETELVIIVTPYLVEPTSPDNLRTPVDRVNPAAGAIDQLLMGRTDGVIRPGAKGTSKVRRGGFLLQ
ncbi:type II and III secretion system protein family protein [Xinfangfangia sp. CPCC 101601]|uniref:Type II and III secretion system protein family protein n=1 Tax=Pseudogemmobacter lacusdianii TaxID=3069608 RepID=A0ABU0VWQ8_9RHOB|nr:type II and III secretion system protein family protein [Xinfangfangia sp. CPCC 101601]MDQ2065355.1 type II and III secretion system protein family protein [Xinfangfangia sp. CPCC 101601]